MRTDCRMRMTVKDGLLDKALGLYIGLTEKYGSDIPREVHSEEWYALTGKDGKWFILSQKNDPRNANITVNLIKNEITLIGVTPDEFLSL